MNEHDERRKKHRRSWDTIGQFIAAFGTALSGLMCIMFATFYLNLPKEIASFRETYARDMERVSAKIDAVQRRQEDVAETLRGLPPVRDSVIRIEGRVDRLEKRVDAEPTTWLGKQAARR